MFLPACKKLLIIALLLLFSVCPTSICFGYGDGGDSGDGDGDDVDDSVALSGSAPPAGFTPTSADISLDTDFMDVGTQSVESSNESRTIEDEIVQSAEEQKRRAEEEEKNRPLTRMDVFNRAQAWLDAQPPEYANQLRRANFTSTEILTIKAINDLRRQGHYQAADHLERRHAEGVSNRRSTQAAKRRAQHKRDMEDLKWAAEFAAGVAVNYATGGMGKVGVVLNVGYNVATGGASGGVSSAATTYITRKLPGSGSLARAFGDAVVQEGVKKIGPTSAH